ncbi:hypothetical protein, conserved [Leishmania tarentolae]|uniref:carnosine N-methyltransferase n=1 Tax=Leishmania tarentolae TaxID=5689 RepID=A0A640KXA3_LEITA|nr:hypothetical protein, conserved [Leishmania tarentolae]
MSADQQVEECCGSNGVSAALPPLTPHTISGKSHRAPGDEHQDVAPPPYSMESSIGLSAPLYQPHSPAPGAVINPDMVEDHVSFLRTVRAFHDYKRQALAAREMRCTNFRKLQDQHRDLLCIDLDKILEKYLECIEVNSTFFDAICEASEELFDSYWPEGTTVLMKEVPPPTPLDMNKVFSTLRQFVRDWSAEGVAERDCVYKPILDTLDRCFPNREERDNVRVLIPGAGLCRLSVELALRGFFAQANEFSYHMLIAGHYIQNHVFESCQHKIYPYSDSTCNLVNRADQFAEVQIPDLCASEAIDELRDKGLSFGQLSMVAGDFTEVYAKPHQHKTWSVVATCFFIDTAHNIIEYLVIIYNLLAPGGYWVNVGPLLYHFADSADDMSIELSLGEVLTVAQRIGFVLNGPPSFIDTTYTNNQRSMKQLVYRCAFFVLQRPLTDTPTEKTDRSAEAKAT